MEATEREASARGQPWYPSQSEGSARASSSQGGPSAGTQLDSSKCFVGLLSLASCAGFPIGNCFAPRPSPSPTPAGIPSSTVQIDMKDIDIELPMDPVASWATASSFSLADVDLREVSDGLQPSKEAVRGALQLKVWTNRQRLKDDLTTFLSAMRENLAASARAQSSATIAVHIPRGCPCPDEKSIARHALRHPPEARGWFPLTDGSQIGLLQLRPPKEARGTSESDAESVVSGFSGISGQSGRGEGQAQALCLVRLRVVALLADQLNDGRHLLELWRVSLRDCHEVLNQLVPGMRAWPVHDEHVRREVLLKIAKERLTSVRNFFRLDRGRRYLDVIRLHFGEEVAFLFAWQAHYLISMAWLALVTVPFMVVQIGSLWEMWGASYDMLTQTLLTVLFGVIVTEIWPIQADRKVHRWHSQSECLYRWHMLVLGMLESRAVKARPDYARRYLLPQALDALRNKRSSAHSTPPAASDMAGTVEEQAVEACNTALHSMQVGADGNRRGRLAKRLTRVLQALLLLGILLLQWAMILVFFNFIVWFEIWVIFDWGGCRDFNHMVGEWKCLAADERRGFLGVVMGAMPSICEGAFFELLLALSRITANSFISLFDFPTHEGREFATVAVVFVLEVVGKVGFILTLALAFVPVWNERDADGCASFWDQSLLGKYSLACLKGQVPYRVRLNMLRSAMKGPMLVSGLVGIGIKTLVPLLLESWRRCCAPEAPHGRCCGVCCRHSLGRLILAPLDFVLRVLTLIFQADHGAAGGLKMFCQWPPALDVRVTPRAPMFSCLGEQSKEESAKVVRQKRLWKALLEGQRREFDPFNEYIEVLLHFLWISCFAIVWPLGCAFALLNQFLEYRFDALKLLSVRRRRFPSSRHMSVAWVPKFAQAICHISIFVNVAILMLPYRIASHLSGSTEVLERIENIKPILSPSEWPMIFILFIFLWAFLVSFRAVCIWLVQRSLPYIYYYQGIHLRSGLHKDREAEIVRSEQGRLADALDGICSPHLQGA